MSFIIDYNFNKLLKIEHECDFEYDPELDNIITFTSHFSDILYENESIGFSIFINNIDLKIYPYDFGILVEQLPEAIENIECLNDFIGKFKKGGVKGITDNGSVNLTVRESLDKGDSKLNKIIWDGRPKFE